MKRQPKVQLNLSEACDDGSKIAGGTANARHTRLPSPGLAWAITGGEMLLWGALAWVFADYWIMLPVRFRWAGILILAALATIVFLRLALFYRRHLRSQRQHTNR